MILLLSIFFNNKEIMLNILIIRFIHDVINLSELNYYENQSIFICR